MQQREESTQLVHFTDQGTLAQGPKGMNAFGILDRDDDSLSTQGLLHLTRPKKPFWTNTTALWAVLGTGVVMVIILSSIALGVSSSASQTARTAAAAAAAAAQQEAQGSAALISKIAFGSCSSYDLRPQTVWVEGIIPSAPDAWIWVGDMAYLDDPVVSCDYAPELCNCTLDYIRSSPTMCHAGHFAHGRERMSSQVNSPEYRQFLEYMCPSAAAQGLFPPPGSDRRVCPKLVMGVYDDHDYGWNNGNRRLPNKDLYKQLFLDALGEPANSPRRNMNTGMQTSVMLNEDIQGREIQVIMLDERYERDTLPCQMRREWCQAVLSTPNKYNIPDPWCTDFLVNDGQSGAGSCCFKDEQLAAWCAQAPSLTHPLYLSLCDPTSSLFGTRQVALHLQGSDMSKGGGPGDLPGPNQTWEVYDATLAAWDDPMKQKSMWRWLTQDSPFCDVLGSTQRQWLRQQLGIDPPTQEKPPSSPVLRLIVSGSVPFGSMNYYSTGRAGLPSITCSGDDWNCYGPAQMNLLHTIANASGPGCVVLLTGDYHYGDIKVVQPQSRQPYSATLQTNRLNRPVYQIMSSGMSDSTAQGSRLMCPGSFGEDLVGLRTDGACAYTPYPNFGMVRVDWDKHIVSLEIQDAKGTGIANGLTGQPLQLKISLDTCQIVK